MWIGRANGMGCGRVPGPKGGKGGEGVDRLRMGGAHRSFHLGVGLERQATSGSRRGVVNAVGGAREVLLCVGGASGAGSVFGGPRRSFYMDGGMWATYTLEGGARTVRRMGEVVLHMGGATGALHV